ncbi:helix-turn-helix domain-containing protein [Streptomyces sp. NPDC006458]|uniref:TetR/AcrR family transcriptional regulator n=1 Tax=Streptomyces sp. NPDC006458 TaxID=3154302 RepID=UPI0033AA7C6E
MSAGTERLRDPQQRAERAARILDAAAGLLTRHGYRRVTMDDVASETGIGKGTVYLHWKTREQLFGAVFAREVLRAVDDLRQALQRDPQTCLLHNFARVYYLAIVDRPLLRGLLLGDPHLLGKLTGSPDPARDDRHAALTHSYLALLAEHDLVRDDLSVDEIGYTYQAMFEGFLRAEGSTPIGSPEQHAELLALTVRRALENEAASGLPVKQLAAATVALLDDLIDADRAAFGLPEV